MQGFACACPFHCAGLRMLLGPQRATSRLQERCKLQERMECGDSTAFALALGVHRLGSRCASPWL